MEDKLVITGIHENIDGEYPCDLIGMLTVGHPNSLTNRELHRIKTMTGITANNLFDAIREGDMDAEVGLAAVVLTRSGKRYDDDWIWDAPMGAAIVFDIKTREEEELPPESDVPANTPNGASETNGGVSSDPESGNQESGQNPTGNQP